MLVVHELNRLPRNTFLHVLLLLQLEHVRVKLLLKFLVGVVNAELLKGVLCEYFEAKDVEQADEVGVLLLVVRRLTVAAD